MLKMEDSGIDSDSKSNSNGAGVCLPSTSNEPPVIDVCAVKFSGESESSTAPIDDAVDPSEQSPDESSSPSNIAEKFISPSVLQKHLEKHILQTKRFRQKEKRSCEDTPKKLLPRNRLKVPKSSQVPIVSKLDSHPLVSWESESDDDEFDFHPMSRTCAQAVTKQLIKDGFNLDLTPDDEDLDLIPPKAIEPRCICCNPNYACIIL